MIIYRMIAILSQRGCVRWKTSGVHSLFTLQDYILYMIYNAILFGCLC